MTAATRDGVAKNRIAKWILFVALAGAPLPFGSREPSTIAFWCCLLGVGLLFASPRHLRRPHFIILFGITVVIAGYAFVLYEQLAIHPWIALFNPIWPQTAKLIDVPIAPSAAIVHDQPFYAIGAPLADVLALTLGLVVGAERSNARLAIRVLAWAGLAYALYGILSLLISPSMILWREKTDFVGNLTSTFVNRNTAGTYFGSCAAVWLILLMLSVRERLPRGPIAWRKAPAYILTDTPAELTICSVACFACLIALFMTASRGGVISSLLGLVFAFAAFFHRDLKTVTHSIMAIVIASAALLLLLQFIGGSTGYRFDMYGLADEGRLSVYRSTMQLIAANPWFGTGLGTFPWAFPPDRMGDISMAGVWYRAHSTPLEVAAELGIPLASLVAFVWLIGLVVLARALRGPRRLAAVPLAALVVALIALLHSTVDFPLQVPGYAIVVFGLLGVGLAQSTEASQPRK